MSIFDTVIDRRGTDSTKWNAQSPNILPLWVADMDFASPQPVISAMSQRLAHPVFGYVRTDDSVYQAVIDYYRQCYGTELEKDWIVFLPGINIGANLACRVAEGDLMMATPVYSHVFTKLADEAGKKRVAVPLRCDSGRFSMDFEAMEEAVRENSVGVFLLCNPHNPVGRVFTREELEELLTFARHHDILVVSDEIHSDLVLSGRHIPFFTLGDEARAHSITLHSVTKTYNLPGVPIGFAVIPNEELRERFNRQAFGLLPGLCSLSVAAMKAALRDCEPWRQELLDYLRENQNYLRKRVAAMDKLSLFAENEATYMAWIDASGLKMEHPYSFFLEQAQVRFGDGADFGDSQCVRINFACPRSILAQALNRVEVALIMD